MNPRQLATLSLLFALTPSALAKPSGAAVHWLGKARTIDELPSELGDGPRQAIEFWQDWVTEHDYRMELGADGRVLYVVADSRRSKRTMRTIEKTCASFDAIAPPSVEMPPQTLGSDASASNEPDEVVTDVEVQPGAMTWSWEDTGPELETQTAVLFDLDDVDDYRTVLDRLADEHEYLRAWAASSRTRAGFVLEEPLCAAWIRNLSGMEEWSPEAEMINRTAQLLFLRRFGQQPFWLTMGLAWYIEDDIRSSIYCFPYRDDFVSVAEHDDWDKLLRSRYRKRDALAANELTNWKRGTFDKQRALTAFGFATFLARHHTDALPGILTTMREQRIAKGRVNHDDGTWELIPGYELPAEQQDAVFARYIGDDWKDELLESFQKGRKYRP